MQVYINKLYISPEAESDYYDITKTAIDKKTLKDETEEYITNMNIKGKYLNCYRILAKYYDEDTEQTILFFIYRDIKLVNMQMWELKGICRLSDYDEELEDSGIIRSWLNTKIFGEDE